MVRVLVTGGAGFIGKHLVRDLLEKDHTVTIFDNFSNSTKDSISSLVNMGAKITVGDITNKKEISNAIKNQDIVIHLAAKISVLESIKNPQETMHVNVHGTMNVIEECKINNVKNTIVISSAAVYGDICLPQMNLNENDKTNPLSPYGKSKLIMEEKIKEFVKANKMNCIIFRIFNIYGLGQTKEYAGVITKFASRIYSNNSLIIHGDGMQTRDFISVEDVVSIINSAMQISDKYGYIYNIGYGKSITIKDLANTMLKITGKKLPLEFMESNEGDIKYSQVSIKRAQTELGYLPKISLEEGIRNFLNRFQE